MVGKFVPMARHINIFPSKIEYKFSRCTAAVLEQISFLLEIADKKKKKSVITPFLTLLTANQGSVRRLSNKTFNHISVHICLISRLCRYQDDDVDRMERDLGSVTTTYNKQEVSKN